MLTLGLDSDSVVQVTGVSDSNPVYTEALPLGEAGYRRVEIIFEKKNQKSSTYIWQIVLSEGKNREIRKIFEYLNVKII